MKLLDELRNVRLHELVEELELLRSLHRGLIQLAEVERRERACERLPGREISLGEAMLTKRGLVAVAHPLGGADPLLHLLAPRPFGGHLFTHEGHQMHMHLHEARASRDLVDLVHHVIFR
jgi:hypothetical protein